MGRHRNFEKDTALLSAMDVFWERGYASSAVSDLCKSMDLNPGSVYAAFGNKHTIFLSAVQTYLEKVTAEGIDMIDASADGVAGIRGYFEYVAEGILTGRRRYGCLGTNSLMEMGDRDEDVRSIMLDHLDLLREAFCNALERSGVSDSQERSAYFLCVAQGLNVLARTDPDRASLMAIIQNTFDPLEAASRPIKRQT